MSTAIKSLAGIEIRFIFEGERWIARIGDCDTGKRIEVNLDIGPLHKTAGQLTTQLLQHGLGIKDIRRAVFAGPLAILLDRSIALPQTKRGRPNDRHPTCHRDTCAIYCNQLQMHRNGYHPVPIIGAHVKTRSAGKRPQMGDYNPFARAQMSR